jgi:hypothetical protein
VADHIFRTAFDAFLGLPDPLAFGGDTDDVHTPLTCGPDGGSEIKSVAAQNLGETVLLHDGLALAAFAVCHRNAGSEAGSGTLCIKFAAARSGEDAAWPPTA